MYGGARRFGLGDALDDYAQGDNLSTAYAADPAMQQLHQLALLIVDLRSQYDQVFASIADASADVDPNELIVIAQQIQQYVARFAQLRGTINAQTQQMFDLSPIDQAMLAVATWAQNAGNLATQAGSAVLNLPTTVANYLAQQLANIAAAGANAAGKAAGSAFSAMAPILIGVGLVALGAIAIVGQAEKTRTGRALARRV